MKSIVETIVDVMQEQKRQEMLKIVQQNQSKIEFCKDFGDDYYKMLGDLVNDCCPIQEAIDKCYNHFSKQP